MHAGLRADQWGVVATLFLSLVAIAVTGQSEHAWVVRAPTRRHVTSATTSA
jgi:hypothetical protein